jgi:hypothetical protein
MAKAKKSPASDAESKTEARAKVERKPPAKKGEAKKSESRKSAAAQTTPVVNPSQAAVAAAAMVGNKVQLPDTSSQDVPQTASFRALKDSLNKPHSQTIGGILDKFSSPGQKKSASPFAANKQVGHSQTFGADVSRKNVPRRTGG